MELFLLSDVEYDQFGVVRRLDFGISETFRKWLSRNKEEGTQVSGDRQC
jgi:hypothetical protein